MLTSGAPRSAENQTGCAQRSGNVGYGFGGRLADRITKQWGTIAGLLFGGVENLPGLGIFLPFTFRVLLGHETLLAHEEQIEPSAGLARLAQSEIERAPGAANGAENGFARASV